MNGNHVSRCCMAAVAVLAFVPFAQARDWTDMVTTPFVDPMFARPPVLDTGKTLPGDREAYTCNGSNHEFTKPLTLSDAIDLALCHNPQVQSAWAAIKAQSAQVGEARAAYLPTLNAGISRMHQKTRYPESSFQVNTDQTNDSKYYTLTWRLLDLGGRDAHRRSASASLEAALASHDAVLQKSMANVIGLYFDAQTARANREAKETDVAFARQTQDIAHKREARGAGAQSDTLQARTALARAELAASRATGAYEKALVALGVAMGAPGEAAHMRTWNLAPDYQDADNELRQELSAWLDQAREHHPAIVAARAQVQSAREKHNAARSEGLPTLDFSQSQYVNGRPNQGLTTTQTRESVVGFTLNIPLFEGFSRTYKVRGAQAQIEIKEADLQDTRIQVLGEVAKAYAEGVSAIRNLESSRRLLEAAQAAQENVRRKYERGVSDLLEMLNVQMALADAQHERIRAMAEWRSARLRLAANAGMVGVAAVRGRQEGSATEP